MILYSCICVLGAETPTLWRAATVPIPDIYLPIRLRIDKDIDYTSAATDCLAVLEEGNFTEHCEDMSSSLKDHFLEACIRDYNITGPDSATSMMLSALIFYCQGALDVDECKLNGFFDFCRPVDEGAAGFMWWIIIVIVLILVIIIIIIVVVIYKKKQKRKRLIEGTEDDMDGFHTLSSKHGYFHPGVESETSFIEGRSSSAWSDGRRSVDSIDSRFFESPVMFLGAPPDRFVYRDYGKSPTSGTTPAPSSRMSGGPGSRMSGRSMSIDITVSPTPEPEQIDNRTVTAVSSGAAFNRGRRSSSPGMAPTPTEVSHLPSPVGTNVQRPKPPSQDVLGNRSIIPPGLSTKADHPPPKITSSTTSSNDTTFKPSIPFGAARRSDHSEPKLAPAPGRLDALASPPPGTSGNETRRVSLPAGPSNNTVPKLAPPPGRSGRLDETTPHPAPKPLKLAPGAPTPQPQFAPSAPQSLRFGGGGTSSPWKTKAAPPLPAPSSLTARILRNSNASGLASTPAPGSDNQSQQ